MANVDFASKSEILDLLAVLNSDNPVDCKDLLIVCERNLLAFEGRKTSYGNVTAIADATKININDSSPLWKYMQISLSLCYDLGNLLDSSDLLNPLSVQEVKNVKNIFRNLIGIGISSNLLPNLAHHSKLPYEESICVFTRYKRLNATTHGIVILSKFQSLKPILFPYYLKWVLSALYQIIFCPIRQPSDKADENGFIMTQDIYVSLVSNREVFRGMLEYLGQSIHAVSYIRETMLLIGHRQSPIWLKRFVSSTLTSLVCKPKGVERLAWAMLDTVGVDDGDDSTKSWKVLEAVGKIVLETTKRSDFRENISEQICGLLKLKGSSGGFVRPFERLFAQCTSSLFHQNEQLCQETFIKHLLGPLTCLTAPTYVPTSDDLFPVLSQRMRILQSLLTDENFAIPLVVRRTLHSVIHVVFRLYSVTYTSSDLKSLIDDIKTVLLRFIRDLNADEQFVLFDLFLFDFASEGYSKIRSDLEMVVQETSLLIRSSEFAMKFRTSHKAETLISITKGSSRETTLLFAYFLNCLSSPDKYFDTSSVNTELLHLETEAIVDEVSDRKITAYKLLASLAEDSEVQEYVNKDPAILVQYMRAVLLKSIEKGLHEKQNCESDDFQNLFLVVMLCQVLVDNTETETLSQYRTLVPQLEAIAKGSNVELSALVQEVLTKLKCGQPKANLPKAMTPLDKAIQDICDPLLPVRGHGLMELAKLVEAKDKSTLERKYYILSIFQQNLKDEDSFIYLAAINGVAAMADLFPDIVLTVLTDEFSECSRSDNDGHEVRIKIGEVLVRVVKRLGEMAPMYKSLLLNTFLVGTKDEDHLVRASSLSNLGEVCRVLGYKLGTIVTEVLVCVHGVISTDKMIEPRRAAVTVIRQLFVGLEKETVVFLKDEILHVYRTLKEIYRNDADDVMRLQAQLALEQLNENVKEFLFVNPTLHYEKKIVILDAK